MVFDCQTNGLSSNCPQYDFRDNPFELPDQDVSQKLREGTWNNNHRITRQDRFGNTTTEDPCRHTVTHSFNDGRTVVRNLSDNSVLAFDADQHLRTIKDAAGQKYQFSDYDRETGQPRTVVNQHGKWTMTDKDTWLNRDNGHYWFGKVEVDKKGSYSYTELSGHKVEHFANGDTVEQYGGIITTHIRNGSTRREYADGAQFKDSMLEASPQFFTKDGVATLARLNQKGGDVSVVHGHDDIRASIATQAQAPVAAFQDGLVVYSSRQPDKNDQRAHSVIGFSNKDMDVIDSFRKHGNDVVVVQCYDKASGGVRYQIYSVDGANVVTGDAVRKGQPIGRADQDGTVEFAIRRNRVSGAPVEIMHS